MEGFPHFMQQPVNRIEKCHNATPGVAGYVYDGADCGQMVFWTCRQTASCAPHVYEFDE